MSTTRRRTAIAAVAATGLFVLAGCGGTTRPGAAAVIGGQAIDDGTLLQAVDAALMDPAVRQRFAGTDPRAAVQALELSRLIRQQLTERVAAEVGAVVTRGDVDQRVQALVQQAGGPDQLAQAALQADVPPADIRESLRLGLLREAIVAKIAPQAQGQAAQLAFVQRIADAARRAGVVVNPRFGQFDLTTLQLVPRDFAVSSPAPVAPGLSAG